MKAIPSEILENIIPYCFLHLEDPVFLFCHSGPCNYREFIWCTQMVGLQKKTTREERQQYFIEIKIVSIIHYFKLK